MHTGPGIGKLPARRPDGLGTRQGGEGRDRDSITAAQRHRGKWQMAGAGNDQGAALDRITESVAAKFAVRVMMPLLTLIAIPLIVAQWRGMVGSVGQLGTKIEAVSSRQASLEREVTTINTKLDAGLIWRLTELERRFEAMQDRIDARGPAPAAPPR